MEELVEKDNKAKTPGVRSENQISEAGRKILGFHFERMISHEAGARLGEDIEAVHDMRVAARRMRVALELFTPFYKKKAVKAYSKGLRGTTRALARVRDLDVFAGKLNEHLESLPDNERFGFEEFLSHCGEKYKKARSNMIHFLDSDQYQLFTGKFGQFLSTPDEGTKRMKINQPSQVRDLAPIMIYERLAAVRAYDQVLGSGTIKELHTLRMELKKLRYTFEFFRDVLGPESREIIHNIKILQDHLGNLNDADVAYQIVNEFFTNLDEKQAPLPLRERQNTEPIFTYFMAKSDERDCLIASFPEAWRAIMGRALSEKIAKAISTL